MDGVVDVRFAVEMGKLGGLAVLNLEGVQTRYKNPEEVLLKVLEAEKEHVTALLQKIYQEPVQEDLIAARIKQMKDGGVLVAVSSIPQKAERYGQIAQEAGADIFVVQSTVSTVRHVSNEYRSLDLARLCKDLRWLRSHSGNYGVRGSRSSGWRRPGGSLHFTRSFGIGRPSSHCDGGLRSSQRLLSEAERSICPDHH
jgi:hypothetical protein